MPCHSAITDNPVTVSPETTVEDVLKKMASKKADYAVVVSKKKIVEGLFSSRILLRNLIPVSVAMADGTHIDIGVKAAPGVAKRMRKVLPIPVSQVMERKMNFVRPETPTWEGINILVQKGDPLIVVEDEDLLFLGIITSVSALEDLKKLEES